MEASRRPRVQCKQPGCTGLRTCRACRRLYMRTFRLTHHELSPEQRLKANARSYANVYQRRGHLQPQPCEQCGTMNPCRPCEVCGLTVHISSWPWCPHGKPYGTAISDELRGGARFIENLGDEPVWVETESQLKREARARGLRPFVRHAPGPHGDKSKHTTRWV